MLTHEGGSETKWRSHYSSASKRWQLVFESELWLPLCSGNNNCKMKSETHEGSYTNSRKMKAARQLRERSIHADSHKTKAVRWLGGRSSQRQWGDRRCLNPLNAETKFRTPQLVLDHGVEDIDSQRAAATKSKMKQLVLQSARPWKKRSVVQRWSRDDNWCLNLICGCLYALALTTARWSWWMREQSYAPIVVERGQ